jgi:hypothetical protein
LKSNHKDLSITKVCDFCSNNYNPRYGYQAVSRFCSQLCYQNHSKNLPKSTQIEKKVAEYEVYKPKDFSPPRG